MQDMGGKLAYSLYLALLLYLLWAVYSVATVLPDFAGEVDFSLALLLLVPLGMLLLAPLRANPWGRLLAGLLTLATVFALHMEVILAGQSRPLGPLAEGLPPAVSYTPSLWEYLVVVFSLAVLLLAATLGEKYLGPGPRAG